MPYDLSIVEQILVALTVVIAGSLAWVYRTRCRSESHENSALRADKVIEQATVLKGKRVSGTSRKPEIYEDKQSSSSEQDTIYSNSSSHRDTDEDEAPSMPNFHNFTRDFGDKENTDWPLGGGCPMAAIFSSKENRDPKEFCDHIQSEVKKAEQNVTNQQINKKLTAEQIAEEKKTQRAQVEAIYRMMSQDGDRFGMETVGDMHDQMKLYM